MSINEDIVTRIKELNLTHEAVSFDHITEMMACVVYETFVIPNTTTTVAYAIYKGFTVASGQAACVNPDNFNEELGRNAAIARATEAATNELWKLEGWMLHRTTEHTTGGVFCDVG